MSRSRFENQMIYLIPFTLKLVGLVGLGKGLAISVGAHALKIDSGTLLLLASIPAAQYAVLKYAEWKQLPQTEAIRKQWRDLLRLPFTLPGQTWTFVKESAQEVWNDWRPIAKRTTIDIAKGIAGTVGGICERAMRVLGKSGLPPKAST